MTRARDNCKETLNFLVLENMRVKYLSCDVIPMVEMRQFKILCKGSRQNQLWLNLERKVGRIV